MFLQKLCEYGVADSSGQDMPFMYTPTRIRWLIDLDDKGGFHGFVSLAGEGKAEARGKEMPAPNVQRTIAVKPRLLADTSLYVLGELALDEDAANKDRIRAREKHKAFTELMRECHEQTGESSLKAILRFMAKVETIDLPEDLSPGDNITFQVDGALPMQFPSVRSFWERHFQSDETAAAQCLACGKLCAPVDRWDIKIKGIPGGQSSGTALVSANANAFESYGLEASKIAPTCRSCSERAAKTLNGLIRSESNSLVLGKVRYVFWTRKPTAFSVVPVLREPDAEEVKRLLTSYRSGKPERTELETEAFYAVALGGSGGRVAVKDWLETTVEHAQMSLARWFNLQRLVDWDGQELNPYGLFPLAASLVAKAKGVLDIPPNITRSLIKTALAGFPLPPSMLYQAVRRNQAEQGITRPRATIMKMALLSQRLFDLEEDKMIELDETNREPAYLCGRLLAELENIQKMALPGAKATLVDRFFGTASSAPASVFGNLMRGVQPHLAKLRKEKPGLYNAAQDRLEEIQETLPGFPKVLTMQEQGLFSLGYYHQRAAISAIKRAKAEEKKAVATETAKEA